MRRHGEHDGRVAELARLAAEPVWVVGGAVRDALLARGGRLDIDVAVLGDASSLARRFSERTGATCFSLKEAEKSWRAVFHDGAVFDFTEATGSIERDLARRDFTVDAIAVPLREYATGGWSPIDPLGGADDLAERMVRMVSPEAFTSDPLRMLRAFRLSATLGFHIEEATARRIAQDAALVSAVAPERIARELFLVLGTARAGAAVRGMDAAGLLGQVLPETDAMRGVEQNEYHHLDVLGHSLEALDRLDDILEELPALAGPHAEAIAAFLGEELVAERTRRALLAFATLLHDAGKPSRMGRKGERIIFYGHDAQGERMIEAACERLRLSVRETREAALLVKRHMVPIELTGSPELPRNRRLRFFRRAGGELGVALLLLSLADRRATRGPATPPGMPQAAEKTARALIEDYYSWLGETLVSPPLLRGEDVMEAFGVPPGRAVGKALAAVRTAQLEEGLTDRDEALRLAKEALGRAGIGPPAEA